MSLRNVSIAWGRDVSDLVVGATTLSLSGELRSSRKRAVDLRSAEEYRALSEGLEVRRERNEALDLREVLFPWLVSSAGIGVVTGVIIVCLA